MKFNVVSLLALASAFVGAEAHSKKYPKIPSGTLLTDCRVPGTAAITFDDGPWQWTSELIDSFNRAGAKTTLFMNGNLYGCIYDLSHVVIKAYLSGHQIASHSYSHPHMTQLTPEQQSWEIEQNNLAFKRILGIRPKWFRPPFGEYDETLLQTLKKHDYKGINWSFSSDDWNGQPFNVSQAKYNELPQDLKTIVALNHDPLEITAKELGPWTIEWARKRGLRLVTLSECMGENIFDAYQFVGKPFPKRGEKWECAPNPDYAAINGSS